MVFFAIFLPPCFHTYDVVRGCLSPQLPGAVWDFKSSTSLPLCWDADFEDFLEDDIINVVHGINEGTDCSIRSEDLLASDLDCERIEQGSDLVMLMSSTLKKRVQKMKKHKRRKLRKRLRKKEKSHYG